MKIDKSLSYSLFFKEESTNKNKNRMVILIDRGWENMLIKMEGDDVMD